MYIQKIYTIINTEREQMKIKDFKTALLKEFDNEKSYSWYDLSQMTEVCVSCGSENIEKERNKK